VGDSSRENDIERREAIGCHYQQPLVKVEDLANLAGDEFSYSRNLDILDDVRYFGLPD